MIRETFPRRCRLTRRRDFLRVQGSGERIHLPHFLVVVDRLSAETQRSTRLGVTVTRKVGGAVTRNRIKRLVREAFRRVRHDLPDGLDVVWVAKRNAGTTSFADVCLGFGRLKRRFGEEACG